MGLFGPSKSEFSTIQRIYRLLYNHEPFHTLHLPSLLRAFDGREDALLATMISKLGPEPKGRGPPTMTPSDADIRTNRLATMPLHDLPFSERLRRLFMRYDKQQVSKINDVLRLSKGREETVLAALLNKYCPEHSVIDYYGGRAGVNGDESLSHTAPVSLRADPTLPVSVNTPPGPILSQPASADGLAAQEQDTVVYPTNSNSDNPSVSGDGHGVPPPDHLQAARSVDNEALTPPLASNDFLSSPTGQTMFNTDPMLPRISMPLASVGSEVPTVFTTAPPTPQPEMAEIPSSHHYSHIQQHSDPFNIPASDVVDYWSFVDGGRTTPQPSIISTIPLQEPPHHRDYQQTSHIRPMGTATAATSTPAPHTSSAVGYYPQQSSLSPPLQRQNQPQVPSAVVPLSIPPYWSAELGYLHGEVAALRRALRQRDEKIGEKDIVIAKLQASIATLQLQQLNDTTLASHLTRSIDEPTMQHFCGVRPANASEHKSPDPAVTRVLVVSPSSIATFRSRGVVQSPQPRNLPFAGVPTDGAEEALPDRLHSSLRRSAGRISETPTRRVTFGTAPSPSVRHHTSPSPITTEDVPASTYRRYNPLHTLHEDAPNFATVESSRHARSTTISNTMSLW